MAGHRASALVMLTFCCIELGFSQSSEQLYLGESQVYLNLDVSAEVDAEPRESSLPVYCTETHFQVFLPSGPLNEVKIVGNSLVKPVIDAPSSCGYSLKRSLDLNVLLVNYDGCHVNLEDGRYTFKLLYSDDAGQLGVATVSCSANRSLAGSPKSGFPSDRIPKCMKSATGCTRFKPQIPSLPHPGQSHQVPHFPSLPHPGQSHQVPHFPSLPHPGQSHQVPQIPPFPGQVPPPLLPVNSVPHYPVISLNPRPGGCGISNNKKVKCSANRISSKACLAKGCCFDAVTSVCYYPMDECTADKHFVFAVQANFTNLPVNPMRLVLAGKPNCKPVISNKNFAIFKFSVTDCGTHSFVIGNTIVYLAEVQTQLYIRNLKYGMISRDNPVRLIIECRYPIFSGPQWDSSKALFQPLLVSGGFMVKSPILPPYLLSEGLFGVQLLISEDKTFTKFYPQYHQPLSVLLGKSVYLELRLKSPKPQATLVVHYCVAYSRSARNVLVLIFEGCPNPLDSGNTAILYMKDLPQNRHKRRFEIKAFQFMDLSTKMYLNEEIYFMCSTEVCMPSGTPCVETCFDGKAPKKPGVG